MSSTMLSTFKLLRISGFLWRSNLVSLNSGLRNLICAASSFWASRLFMIQYFKIYFCKMFQFYKTMSTVAINSISTPVSSFKAFFPFSIYLMKISRTSLLSFIAVSDHKSRVHSRLEHNFSTFETGHHRKSFTQITFY
jgi:hypothetical protein